jgi:hypothetical protein
MLCMTTFMDTTTRPTLLADGTGPYESDSQGKITLTRPGAPGVATALRRPVLLAALIHQR